MVASNGTPSSSRSALWSKTMPSRRMTAMLRAFGVSVTAITRYQAFRRTHGSPYDMGRVA